MHAQIQMVIWFIIYINNDIKFEFKKLFPHECGRKVTLIIISISSTLPRNWAVMSLGYGLERAPSQSKVFSESWSWPRWVTAGMQVILTQWPQEVSRKSWHSFSAYFSQTGSLGSQESVFLLDSIFILVWNLDSNFRIQARGIM